MMKVLLVLFAVLSIGSLHALAEMKRIPIRRRYGTGRVLGAAKEEFTFVKRENDGVYWTDIRIGTPSMNSQVFSVIVDTGSPSIAIPCLGCNCGQQHHYFDEKKSITVKNTGARYNQCYSEGSCNSGSVLEDNICIGADCDTSSSVRHPFGCCTTYARAFQEQEADGIIGMSGASSTLIADMRTHDQLAHDVFALCFGKRGGEITVGAYTSEKHLEPLQWIPMNANGFYSVKVTSVSLGGTVVDTSINNPIVDSGTTFTYVPRLMHEKLKEAFKKWCAEDPAKRCLGTINPVGTPRQDIDDAIACYAPPLRESGRVLSQETRNLFDAMYGSYNIHDEDEDVENESEEEKRERRERRRKMVGSEDRPLTPEFYSSFPNIEISFGEGKSICIPAISYFFLSSKKASSFCVGIFPDSRFVIGAITMAEFNVIFDHGNSQMGWARAYCDDTIAIPLACCGKCSLTKTPTISAPTLVGETGSPTSLRVDTPTVAIAPTTAVNTPTSGDLIKETSQPTVDISEWMYRSSFWNLDSNIIRFLFGALGVLAATLTLFMCYGCCGIGLFSRSSPIEPSGIQSNVSYSQVPGGA